MAVEQLFKRVVRKLRFLRQEGGERASPLRSHVDPAGLLPSQKLHRLGTAYGGWIIPADHGLTADSLCYCAGAGEDISFECALAEQYHCRL